MDEEIYKVLDNIMRKNHELAGYYINLADNEIIRGTQENLLKKLIDTKNQELKQLYIKLSQEIYNESLRKTEDYYSRLGITTLATKELGIEDNVKVDLREDILDYIKESYEQMNFISDTDSDTVSIYDGTPEQTIREIEFETYRNNIASIENREETDKCDDITDWNYIAIAKVIEDLADNELYAKSTKRVDKVIKKLEQGQYSVNTEAELNRIRNKLIYYKYGEMYKSDNQLNNGLVAGSIHKRPINLFKEDNSLYIALGISKEDYSRLYESRVLEGLDDAKNDVAEIFKKQRDSNKEGNKSREDFKSALSRSISKIIKEGIPSVKAKLNGEQR